MAAYLWVPVILCIVQLGLTFGAILALADGVASSSDFYNVDTSVTLLGSAILCVGVPRWFTFINLIFNLIRLCIPAIHRTKAVKVSQIIFNVLLGIVVFIGAILFVVTTKTYCSSGCSGSVIAGDVLAFIAALSYFGAAGFWFSVDPDTGAPPPPPQQPYGAQYPPGTYAATGYPAMGKPGSNPPV
eukprot:TRINITY_DN18886_c0_g1_i1.p1 TRINITY_DN18886_c0_g1~~TRINITY_DN18886_c0_g1_i1.p1  ORF type:complete len:186 (+),score=6.67 TRINITY_DN18886_c0_g1_i1:150-707(+)